MNAEIVTLSERWVVGTQSRIQPVSADYGTIWAQGFDPHQNEIATVPSSPVTMGSTLAWMNPAGSTLWRA